MKWLNRNKLKIWAENTGEFLYFEMMGRAILVIIILIVFFSI